MVEAWASLEAVGEKLEEVGRDHEAFGGTPQGIKARGRGGGPGIKARLRVEST